MKKLTGFAVLNCEVGKKIAFTYSEIDDDGVIIKSNNKESFAVVDSDIEDAIKIIENHINNRLVQ